ncbi:unnamed protein product [Nesidiocoris tenuis]|uniref:PDZ domain-containing protein n=1 Tax=Nesidiocoris tenuis TaxID=355587 RepID=A0A6H5GLH1_9HEMI|nr:unnamed protein product [Nesidiocoris tenuis]
MVSERNVAVRERNGLKQQCTAAIRQWDIALRERNEYQEALAKIQQQHEEAVKEINQAMAVKMKASKDLKRLTDERNAAMQEYSLIMSERDTVHKEMEKLTEDLTQAKKKNKVIEAEAKQFAEEKKALTYQVETLKREIASALHDRDKALKEVNDLRQRGGEFKDRNQMEGVKTRYDPSYRDRDTGRKNLRESQSSSMDLFSKCHKERMDNLDQANQEIDKLNKQVDKLQAELQEAFQEAEVSKRRRDWAFSERDKIVMERESIRTLCDRLRKERDRAVSDLAEALRDSDDINKQRAETNKQLKNGLSSTEDLGVELAGGRDDPHYPNDNGIYVTSISKGSVADGKLKYDPLPPPKPRSKWSRDSSEDKKRNRNSSPVTFEHETDDAIAELDSVIDNYHPKGTIRRRVKHSDRNGGTWPKVRGGPHIDQGTGTIVHPKKNKERLPLSVIMNNSPRSSGYPLHHYYDPSTSSPRSLGGIDYTLKSGTVSKDLPDYYKMKSGGAIGGGPSPVHAGPPPDVQSRIHSQLYGAPHIPPHHSYVHPHPHPHPAPPPPSYASDSPVRSPCLPSPMYPQFHHHSPSVDTHFNKSQTLTSASHHGGGHTSDDGGDPTPSYHHPHYEVATLPRKHQTQRFRPFPGELRRVHIDKSAEPLGIQISCLDSGGVFVSTVSEDSLACRVGLRVGDQLLEVCGINMRSATYELAANVLRQCGNSITMLVQYSPERYNEIKDKPGDSFYIRALFDRQGDSSDQLQLRFRKDDILYVDNTMFNGVPGSWRAYLVDEHGRHSVANCGIIPSKYKVEEEVVRRSLGDLEGEARRATRRSFFRRKKHHQRTDSKELASFSNFTVGWYSDSGTLNEESSLASYQRVVMLDYPALRPVIIVGPLSDWVTDKLLQDFPDKFTRLSPEMMHCSQAAMEKGIADSVFVDYRKKGNYFECVPVSAIKDMHEKVLDESFAMMNQ